MKIILRLIVFVGKHWANLLFGFVCITASTVGGLVIPRLLGNGIDTALSSGSKTTILVLAGVILGTTVIRSAARFGDTYITQVVSQQASYDLRNALYDHLHQLGFAYYDQAQTGQIMSRCTADIEAAHMERAEPTFSTPGSSGNSWTRALEAERPGPGTSGPVETIPVAPPPVHVDPNGESGPLHTAPTQYCVRMRLEGSPRSRALTISASSEEEAIDRVSKVCGAGWVVIELSEI